MPKPPTLAEIENAFLPAKEIDSADRFAGRREQLEASYLALVGRGTNLAVIGNRGIGKTSLARQVVNIASGNAALLERAKVTYERSLDFLPIYFACGSDTESIPQLLGKLLTNQNCLADWIYDIPQASKAVGNLAPKFASSWARRSGSAANWVAWAERNKPRQRLSSMTSRPSSRTSFTRSRRRRLHATASSL